MNELESALRELESTGRRRRTWRPRWRRGSRRSRARRDAAPRPVATGRRGRGLVWRAGCARARVRRRGARARRRRHARRLARGALDRAALARPQERRDQARAAAADDRPRARPRHADRAAAAARRVPAALGAPDAVYRTHAPRRHRKPSRSSTPARRRSSSRPSARRPRRSSRRRVGSADDVERLEIDGARAYWITGAHGFAYQSPPASATSTSGSPDRVLLVERDGLLIRVEGAISRDSAGRDRAALVQRRVRRHRRQQRVAVALAAQDRRPQVVGVLGEDLLARGRLDDPRLLGELVLELARPPAGVAGEDAGAADRAVEALGVVGVGADEAEVGARRARPRVPGRSNSASTITAVSATGPPT